MSHGSKFQTWSQIVWIQNQTLSLLMLNISPHNLFPVLWRALNSMVAITVSIENLCGFRVPPAEEG